MVDLLSRHLELECIGLDRRGRMVPIPGPFPDEISRVYVARDSSGYHRLYRYDLPTAVCATIETLAPEEILADPNVVLPLLAAHAPCEDVWVGVSYTFPETLKPTDYPDAVTLDHRRSRKAREQIQMYDPELLARPWPVSAVIRDGIIVASCVSARENGRAGEAWVRTHPAYRRRGYARQVTAAWAKRLLSLGKIPFYSHRLDNPGSAGVARSLGLQPFIQDVGYL